MSGYDNLFKGGFAENAYNTAIKTLGVGSKVELNATAREAIGKIGRQTTQDAVTVADAAQKTKQVMGVTLDDAALKTIKVVALPARVVTFTLDVGDLVGVDYTPRQAVIAVLVQKALAGIAGFLATPFTSPVGGVLVGAAADEILELRNYGGITVTNYGDRITVTVHSIELR